jgi:hypothetical protein
MIRESIAKAQEEVVKSYRSKSFSEGFIPSFVAVITAVYKTLQLYFFKVYNYIYSKLNQILPLPFSS